ncbi:MAG: hypothetical protein JJ896_07995 [Rhodothermales bacterium]|nr:hypothetical protein [Rhodothermales bacterium]MBO6779582.1 hypothetical protein [Rhodothermales bacterium]
MHNRILRAGMLLLASLMLAPPAGAEIEVPTGIQTLKSAVAPVGHSGRIPERY